MPVYVVKHLNDHSDPVRLVRLECDSDDIAHAGAAAMLRPGRAAELWCGQRRIGIVACAEIPSFQRAQQRSRVQRMAA